MRVNRGFGRVGSIFQNVTLWSVAFTDGPVMLRYSPKFVIVMFTGSVLGSIR